MGGLKTIHSIVNGIIYETFRKVTLKKRLFWV
jgi:hypothetical protein